MNEQLRVTAREQAPIDVMLNTLLAALPDALAALETLMWCGNPAATLPLAVAYLRQPSCRRVS